uniref:(northern house mosquito) hypothetical protein n=1 Tax=Culex pipiens TaxID=7175 RepID=A0A8D8BGR2_CULPI
MCLCYCCCNMCISSVLIGSCSSMVVLLCRQLLLMLLCLQTAHCSLLLSLSLVCVRFDKQTCVGGVRGNRTGDVLCLACQSVSLEEGFVFGWLQTKKKKKAVEGIGGRGRASWWWKG